MKANPRDYDINACFDILGAHIKACIDDYAKMHKTYNASFKTLTELRRKKLSGKYAGLARKITDYETAIYFLFNGGLEMQIEQYGLTLDPEFVRRKAKEGARNE